MKRLKPALWETERIPLPPWKWFKKTPVLFLCTTLAILICGNASGENEAAPQETLRILVLPFSPIHPDVNSPAGSVQGPYSRQLAAELAGKLNYAKSVKGRFLLLTAEGTNEHGFLVMGEPIRDPDNLVHLAAQSSAQYVVGGFSDVRDAVSLRLWVFDVSQRKTVSEEDFLFPLNQEVAGATGAAALRLLRILGIQVSDTEQAALHQLPTKSWDAYRYYLVGEDNRMAVKAGLTLNSGNSLDPYLNAVRADPNFTEAIALALDLALKMVETPSSRDYVIPSLEELERLRPDFWKIPFSLGHFLDSMNRETEAIEAFRRAVNLKPDFAEGYYRIGKIYELQNKEREAETQYRQALQYDENHARALTSLGTILGNRDQHDEAIQLWLRAVEIDPKSAVALQNLGKAYETKGDETTASQYYARANQENPEGKAGRQAKENLVHLTNLPAASKEPILVLDIPVVTGPFGAAEVRRDEARKDQKQEEFWGQFKEAGDLIKQNRWDEALPILQKLASVKQDVPQLQYSMGLALFKAGRVEEAVTALRTALKLQRDPHVAKQLGVILIRAGRGSEAREALQMARAMEPKDSEVDYYLAELALKERRFSEAEEAIRQAIGKKPSDPDNYVLSAAIQGKRGHWPQALSDLEAARWLGYQSADNLREMERIVQGKWRSERIGRFWLAAVTGYVALLAFLFLAGCVLSLLQGRWVARASERILTANDRTPAERRLSRWYTFTILSAVGLFYLSLPFMVVGMLWGAGYLIYAMLNEPGGELGRPALYFLIAAIGGTWAILRGLFARPMANPLEQSLSEQDQSKLFELLREVAQATGTPMVDEVRVAPDTGIGVHMEGRAIAALLGRAKRVLTIGVATLHALTTPELKAILAHEYGHFSNRDTDYNGVLFQVELSLAHTLQGMASLGRYGWLNPVFWLLKLYRIIYVLITRGFRRTRELFADRVAAVTYGSKAFSSALEKVAVYGAFFERHAYQEVAALLKEQKAFQNVYQAFEEGWNKLEPAVQDQMRQSALTRRPHWTDSHPPVRDRIARLQHLSFNSMDGGEPASTVFRDFPALQGSMSSRLTQYVAALTRAR